MRLYSLDIRTILYYIKSVDSEQTMRNMRYLLREGGNANEGTGFKRLAEAGEERYDAYDARILMDRTMPLSSMAMEKVGERFEHVGQADYAHLRYVMICGCGFPNSKHNFEPAIAQFELMFPSNRTILIVPESPMFNVPEAAIVTQPRLERIREAGRQYVQNGEIDRALLAVIAEPMIPEDMNAHCEWRGKCIDGETGWKKFL